MLTLESLSTLIQGGSGVVALYLAVQIKRVLDNHETRITALEASHASGTNRKPSRKRTGNRRRTRV